MKTFKSLRPLLAIALGIAFAPAIAASGEKTPLPIFMAGSPPSRAYNLLTPISAEKDNVQKAIEKLRSIAGKKHADAVIDISCEKSVRMQSFTGLYSPSYCQGLAVTWQD